MSRQYKEELLKDNPPEGQMLYGIETPTEITKGYLENPLCEHPKQVYKQRRRDKILKKKQDKNKRERNKW